MKKLLRIALIGAPNAGKSTLLNRLVNAEVSSVSQKVHTTRKNILAAYTQDETQLEFHDTPGLVNRQHLLRHKLEDTLLFDPRKAFHKCDLIAVVVDASNPREQKRLNKGVLSLLELHPDKDSILVMNKIDLIKDKRMLLEIGVTLTEGKKTKQVSARDKHDFVIELDKQGDFKENYHYNNFEDVFSISALNDDGVDELRDYFLSKALPVEQWPHGPDFLTNQTPKDLVHQVIRGKVLDYVPDAIPYLVKFKYLRCSYDDLGSLHINLQIHCPERYMVPKVIGERGVNIFRIIEDSRDIISKTLNCDVKLSILVEPPNDKDRF